MQVIFTQKEIDEANATKKRYFTVWLISLFIFLLAIATMFVLFSFEVELRGDRSNQGLYMGLSIALGILYLGATVFLYDLVYRPVRAKVRMFKSLREGPKEKSEGMVISIERRCTQKDDVWFYALVLDCPPVRREQRNVRNVLIEKNRPVPDLCEGDKIKFIAHASILIAYEKKPKEN